MLKLLAIILLLLCQSCASVTIEDHEWCADWGKDGASCFHTISSETRRLDKPTWDALRFGQVCADSSAFANMKAAIEKLCHQTDNCTYQDTQAINAFFDRINSVDPNNATVSIPASPSNIPE